MKPMHCCTMPEVWPLVDPAILFQSHRTSARTNNGQLSNTSVGLLFITLLHDVWYHKCRVDSDRVIENS